MTTNHAYRVKDVVLQKFSKGFVKASIIFYPEKMPSLTDNSLSQANAGKQYKNALV
jgi:hypothetical protein